MFPLPIPRSGVRSMGQGALRAERHEIAARHAPGEWEIIGSPEVRDVDPNVRYFSPWRFTPHAEAMPVFKARTLVESSSSSPRQSALRRNLVHIAAMCTKGISVNVCCRGAAAIPDEAGKRGGQRHAKRSPRAAAIPRLVCALP
jgi:hypothetical protein